MRSEFLLTTYLLISLVGQQVCGHTLSVHVSQSCAKTSSHHYKVTGVCLIHCALLCLSDSRCVAADWDDGAKLCDLILDRCVTLTRDTQSDCLVRHGVLIEPVCTQHILCNPSFECDGGWRPYLDGYELTTEAALDGQRSAAATSGGLVQTIYLPPGIVSFQVQASSRSVNTTGPMTSHYSFYVDSKLTSGANAYGQITKFELGNVAWHVKTGVFNLGKEIGRINCYLLYRYFTEGKSYFDDVKVWISRNNITDCMIDPACIAL